MGLKSGFGAVLTNWGASQAAAFRVFIRRRSGSATNYSGARWRIPTFTKSLSPPGGNRARLSVLKWRLREKAADALHVVAVLITEAIDQILPEEISSYCRPQIGAAERMAALIDTAMREAFPLRHR